MTRAHYDYASLKVEFIQTRPKLSIRELARRHDIPDSKVSSLHAQAKKKDGSGRDWYELQDAFEAATNDKAVERMADDEAKRIAREARVVDKAILLVEEAIDSTRDWIKATHTFEDEEGNEVTERKYRIPIRDLNGLLDRLGTLLARRDGSGDGGLNFGGSERTPALEAGSDPIAFILGVIGSRAGGDQGAAQPVVVRGASRTALPDAPDPSPAQLP